MVMYDNEFETKEKYSLTGNKNSTYTYIYHYVYVSWFCFNAEFFKGIL